MWVCVSQWLTSLCMYVWVADAKTVTVVDDASRPATRPYAWRIVQALLMGHPGARAGGMGAAAARAVAAKTSGSGSSSSGSGGALRWPDWRDLGQRLAAACAFMATAPPSTLEAREAFLTVG